MLGLEHHAAHERRHLTEAVVTRGQPPVAALASFRHSRRGTGFHPTQEVTALEGGAVRLTMAVAGIPEVASWVAGFRGRARPLAPAKLVAAVWEIHSAGLAALGDPVSDG